METRRPGNPPRSAAPIRRPPLAKIYLFQCALLALAGLALLPVDALAASSAVIGGLIAVVPNAWFARQAFRYSGAQMARAVARSFYRGEAGKLVLTVVMFAVVFAAVRPLNVPVLFAGFVAMTLVNVALAARIGLGRSRQQGGQC